MEPFWSIKPATILLLAVCGTQAIATLISVYGFLMNPIGWVWALFIWGYCFGFFLLKDFIKLLAYKIFDSTKA
jgi:H+-transporting ATPase